MAHTFFTFLCLNFRESWIKPRSTDLHLSKSQPLVAMQKRIFQLYCNCFQIYFFILENIKFAIHLRTGGAMLIRVGLLHNSILTPSGENCLHFIVSQKPYYFVVLSRCSLSHDVKHFLRAQLRAIQANENRAILIVNPCIP